MEAAAWRLQSVLWSLACTWQESGGRTVRHPFVPTHRALTQHNTKPRAPSPPLPLPPDYRFDVSKLEPTVAAPHSPDNRKLARECHDKK